MPPLRSLGPAIGQLGTSHGPGQPQLQPALARQVGGQRCQEPAASHCTEGLGHVEKTYEKIITVDARGGFLFTAVMMITMPLHRHVFDRDSHDPCVRMCFWTMMWRFLMGG